MAKHPGPVLVTGANSGIGLAAVLRFAQRGWETWGTVRSDEKAEVLREAARKAHVQEFVRPLVLDVADDAAVTAAFVDLPDFYAVVNNAGYAEVGAIEEVTAREARAQLDINLVAPAIVSSCALPGMRRLGGGRIVMVSSAAGRASLMPLNGWYHASKFGLEALSDVLRMEVAGFGIRVSIVEPGFFKTGITGAARDRAEARRDRESIYGSAYERTASLTDAILRLSPEPDAVARTIVAAVESRNPQRRYLVGLDAVASVITSAVVPRGIIDATARFVSDLGAGPARPPAIRARTE